MSLRASSVFVACATWLAACFGPGGAGGATDADADRINDGDRDGGPGRRPPFDDKPIAPDAFDGGLGSVVVDGGVTVDQAKCLGLENPVCAVCHTHPTRGELVLRPSFAPPPPPDMVFTAADLQACGVDTDLDPDADAGR